jgi:hypothetical protein
MIGGSGRLQAPGEHIVDPMPVRQDTGVSIGHLAAAGTAATDRIYQQHWRDGGAELMPSPGPRAGELAGMLDYVRAHPLRDKRYAAADARDALTILRYLREWANGMELAMLILGRDSDLTWHELADAAGWHSKQAAQQRVRYLKGRAARREGDSGGRDAPASRDEAFLVRESRQIRTVSEAIASAVLPDAKAQESAEELALELTKTAPSLRWLMIWLVIVLDELKVADGLGALAPGVRRETVRLVGEWDQLGAAGRSG